MHLPRIPFTFSYQSFTRYVRDNCDSEQEVDGSLVNERWLYKNMAEYLNARASHLYEFTWEKFIPAEFHTRLPGRQKNVDMVATSKKAANSSLSIVLEAKLMIDDNRSWARQIVTDLLRVACIKDQTNRRTQRYVMVAGQERCWTLLSKQCDGFLPALVPMERQRDPKTLWLRPKRKWTSFSDRWRTKHEDMLEDYLLPLLPSGVGIELTGCSKSNRGPDEQPEAGITTRLWRVFPK